MRNFLKVFTPGVIVGLLLGSPILAFAAAFLVTQGGTGQTTFTQGVIYSPGGTKAFQSTATTSATCAGSVTCTAFTVFGSAPITITGSASGSGNVATSSSETATYIPFWTSTAGTPALLSGGNAGFFFTTAATRLTVTNASTTAITSNTASTTSQTISNVPSMLLSTGVQGTVQGTTVSSPLTFSANTLACATCSTASGANPSVNVTLSVQNGSANTFLRSDGAPALSQAIAPTWTALHIFTGGATTTSLSVYNYLQAPTSTNPVLSVAGQIAVNTTAASSSLQVRNGGQFGLYATSSVSFSYATSSPSGTTTLPIVLGPRGQTFNNQACKSIGGTANVQVGNGTASTTMQISATGTPVPITLTSNNVFQAWQTLYIAIGTFSATSVTNVTCGFGRSYDY